VREKSTKKKISNKKNRGGGKTLGEENGEEEG
jgi:hypothetical protein